MSELHTTIRNSQDVHSPSTNGERTDIPVDDRAGFTTCVSGDAMHTMLIEFTDAIKRVQQQALVQVCQQLVASMQSLVHTVRKLTEWLRANQVTLSTQQTDNISDYFKWVRLLEADMVTLSTHTYKHTLLLDTSWTQAKIGVHGSVSHKQNSLEVYRCGR